MNNPKMILVKHTAEFAGRAADMFADTLRKKPDCLFGLATGTTPLPLYRELIARYRRGELDFSKARTANLDEYLGLAPNDVQSYSHFMNENLFDHINLKSENILLLNGMAKNAEAECRRYENTIHEWGGVDLQLLGIGHNGHIGFNEPSDAFILQTHLIKLAEDTRRANAKLFQALDEVPTEALTLGCGTIFAARKILLLATGQNKAEILERAFYGTVTPQVPASLLQLHPDVTIIADEQAGEAICKHLLIEDRAM